MQKKVSAFTTDEIQSRGIIWSNHFSPLKRSRTQTQKRIWASEPQGFWPSCKHRWTKATDEVSFSKEPDQEFGVHIWFDLRNLKRFDSFIFPVVFLNRPLASKHFFCSFGNLYNRKPSLRTKIAPTCCLSSVRAHRRCRKWLRFIMEFGRIAHKSLNDALIKIGCNNKCEQQLFFFLMSK